MSPHAVAASAEAISATEASLIRRLIGGQPRLFRLQPRGLYALV